MEESLHEWLVGQGYPLEMLVAQGLIGRDARVSQSDYYIDYETGKPREIDVIARWYRYRQASDSEIELEVYYCIECKSQQKKPWIVFSSREQSIGYFSMPPASVEANKILAKFRKELNSTQLFGAKLIVGYGVTQAFTNGRDIPYKAISSATKAAVSMSLTPSKAAKKRPRQASHLWGVIAFPIVVTDGKLFNCYLDVSNQPVIKECQIACIEWKYPKPNQIFSSGSRVYVYTSGALNKLFEHVDEANNMLFKHLNVYVPK